MQTPTPPAKMTYVLILAGGGSVTGILEAALPVLAGEDIRVLC